MRDLGERSDVSVLVSLFSSRVELRSLVRNSDSGISVGFVGVGLWIVVLLAG